MVRIRQADLLATLLILDSFPLLSVAQLWVTFLNMMHSGIVEGMGGVRPLGPKVCCAVFICGSLGK